MSTPLHDLSATELGAAMRAGDLDPVAVTEHFLARIDEFDAGRTIFVRTTPERALAEAMASRARLAAGRPLGCAD